MRGPLGSAKRGPVQQPPNAIRALFLGMALTAIAATIVLSLNPKNYFFYRIEDRDKWTYPLTGVALIVALMLVETALTYLVFTARRPRLLWIRALLGLLILGPWGLFVAMWIVHAPLFYLLHIVYVWLLIAITTLALVVSVAHAGGRWFQTRMPKQT
jgi:hypothetical protein